MRLTFKDTEVFDRAAEDFDRTALEIFRFQYAHNEIYRRFADSLKKTPDTVTSVQEIPFLPVELFKSQEIYCGEGPPEITFTSSGTTGSATSRHAVYRTELYRESFMRGFAHTYGSPENWTFLFLLPSYLEREGSSLIYMAEALKQSGRSNSGFYLHNYAELSEKLKSLQEDSGDAEIMLFGVTYALLDLAEQFPQSLPDVYILETGGMKGRRAEITRDELHQKLCSAFDVAAIHSEYGMTELLSQAYSTGEGLFTCPPWMKIMIRETTDPLAWAQEGKTGGVNIIDLANIYSCSFISTSDLGKVHIDGSFEILGRFDFSDTRGCNLLYEENNG